MAHCKTLVLRWAILFASPHPFSEKKFFEILAICGTMAPRKKTQKEVTCLTKKYILKQMKDSPLMESIRLGSLEDMQKLKAELRQLATERRSDMRRSIFYHIMAGIIGGSIGCILWPRDLDRFVFTMVLCQIVCLVLWTVNRGIEFRKSAIAGKVMLTLLDVAITEKQESVPTT